MLRRTKILIATYFAIGSGVPILIQQLRLMKIATLIRISAIVICYSSCAENLPPALPPVDASPMHGVAQPAPPLPLAGNSGKKESQKSENHTGDSSLVSNSQSSKPTKSIEDTQKSAPLVPAALTEENSTPALQPSANAENGVSPNPSTTPVDIDSMEQLSRLLKENQELQAALERRFGKPISFDAQVPTSLPPMEAVPANEASRKRLMTYLREKYAGTNVDVYLQGEYVVVRIPEATYRIGQVQMPLSIRSRLKPIADAAAQFESSFDLQVEGHSDATPVRQSSGRSNWTVAFSRAESVARELESMKVPDRTLAITSRGSGLLADAANKFSDVNRRVELVFAPKRSLAPLPKSIPVPSRSATVTAPKFAEASPQTLSTKREGPSIRVSTHKEEDSSDIIDLPVLVVSSPVNESATPVEPQSDR